MPVRNFVCDARSSVACKQIVAEIAKKNDHCVMKLVKGVDLATGEATFIVSDGGVDNNTYSLAREGEKLFYTSLHK